MFIGEVLTDYGRLTIEYVKPEPKCRGFVRQHMAGTGDISLGDLIIGHIGDLVFRNPHFKWLSEYNSSLYDLKISDDFQGKGLCNAVVDLLVSYVRDKGSDCMVFHGIDSKSSDNKPVIDEVSNNSLLIDGRRYSVKCPDSLDILNYRHLIFSNAFMNAGASPVIDLENNLVYARL